MTMFWSGRVRACGALALGVGLAAAAVLPAVAQEMGEPTKAQPELAREPLTITGSDHVAHVFSVEIARTQRQQEVGEMFRTSLAADRGMLFVWPYPQPSDMWMKNTLVSLDIVAINADGTINAITENAVPRSLAQIQSNGPVVATLELQGGITAKLGIKVGDKVSAKALPSGG